jgi:cytosine/uracil/thiamine/allantoin permease
MLLKLTIFNCSCRAFSLIISQNLVEPRYYIMRYVSLLVIYWSCNYTITFGKRENMDAKLKSQLKIAGVVIVVLLLGLLMWCRRNVKTDTIVSDSQQIIGTTGK